MPWLFESVSRFFGRVEIFALGAEDDRREAEEALARGRPLEARQAARALLTKVPSSPLGLALWADAAEVAWLDDEVVEALSQLSQVLPWRADVWLRLGRAGLRVAWPEARAALEKAVSAEEDREASREATLALCDLDLGLGDAERAARWLDRAPPSSAPDAAIELRRAEIAIQVGDEAEAARAAKAMLDELDPGRVALVRAQVARAEGDVGRAIEAGTRAFLLDVQGAESVLASLVGQSRDAVHVGRVRALVEAMGQASAPAWLAAFALAEGRGDDAQKALEIGAIRGDSASCEALAKLATERRDARALSIVVEHAPRFLSSEQRALVEAARALERGEDDAVLGLLEELRQPTSLDWAVELTCAVVLRWAPRGAIADWTRIAGILGHAVRDLDRGEMLGATEALTVERERPLRVAVVGEFNAGKSTFLNALLATDVAPTGVLPTTACLHWVAWAPDAFARIVVSGAPDRVVPHGDLKATLRALSDAGSKVSRVYIYAPLELLKRIEILDTPGFNALDPAHAEAARSAFEEAHVVVWLLDATSPLKESERLVLAAVRDVGVGIQILLNKADRLDAEALGLVLEHVRSGLSGAGLTSFAPPVAFSARLALQGKLGDAARFEASGFREVESVITERIVDASEVLRESALRRKALRIARSLAADADARAEEESLAAIRLRELTAAKLAAASRLRADRRSLAVELDRALEVERRRLADDLRPLGPLDREKRQSEGVHAYVSTRFVERFGPLVVERLAAASGVPLEPAASRAVTDVLGGAVAAAPETMDFFDLPLHRVLGAAVEAFARALGASAEATHSPPRFSGLARTLHALVGALSVEAAHPDESAQTSVVLET
jgi:tetratricopeptide (TPR) repeat protein/GTPase SAR1 family protein